AALVDVAQVELARLAVVAVLDLDVGDPEVGHRPDDHVADLLPVLLHDRQLAVLLDLVDVQVQLLDQLGRQVVAQERHVALQLPHLEHLGPAPPGPPPRPPPPPPQPPPPARPRPPAPAAAAPPRSARPSAARCPRRSSARRGTG